MNNLTDADLRCEERFDVMPCGRPAICFVGRTDEHRFPVCERCAGFYDPDWLFEVALIQRRSGDLPARDGDYCFECGDRADAAHHVVPRSLGGTKTIPLCTSCHKTIHATGQELSIGLLSRMARAAPA